MLPVHSDTDDLACTPMYNHRIYNSPVLSTPRITTPHPQATFEHSITTQAATLTQTSRYLTRNPPPTSPLPAKIHPVHGALFVRSFMNRITTIRLPQPFSSVRSPSRLFTSQKMPNPRIYTKMASLAQDSVAGTSGAPRARPSHPCLLMAVPLAWLAALFNELTNQGALINYSRVRGVLDESGAHVFWGRDDDSRSAFVLFYVHDCMHACMYGTGTVHAV